MGTLRLIEKGFETQTIPPEERDAALRNFIYLKNEIKDQDKIVALQAFYEHPFSFGNIIQNFFFAPWEDFRKTKTLSGIRQNTYQLMYDSFAQKPVYTTIKNEDEFTRAQLPHAYTGLKQPYDIPEYVYDVETWEWWHLDWLTQHPNLITWDDVNNEVFPYPKVIKNLLHKEIERRGDVRVWQTQRYSECDEEGKWKIREEEITNAFYESVMKHLSPEERIAYTETLGRQVCKRNHYIYNEKASKIEAAATKSKRMIFEILKDNKKQYISLDFKHGMLEFLDSQGNHLGEKRFDGTQNTGTDSTHSFVAFDNWAN